MSVSDSLTRLMESLSAVGRDEASQCQVGKFGTVFELLAGVVGKHDGRMLVSFVFLFVAARNPLVRVDFQPWILDNLENLVAILEIYSVVSMHAFAKLSIPEMNEIRFLF